MITDVDIREHGPTRQIAAVSFHAQTPSASEVLERVVAAARDIIGADYAALRVIGRDDLLEQFVHLGMDPATTQPTSLSIEGSGEPTRFTVAG